MRVGQASQGAEKLTILSFGDAPRAEESLVTWVQAEERFLASLGMTKENTFPQPVQPVGLDAGVRTADHTGWSPSYSTE